MTVYVTLYDQKRYRARDMPDVDDDLLRNFIIVASRTIDKLCKRRFYPFIETRYYDHPYNIARTSIAADYGYDLRSNVFGTGYLKVDEDLLEVIGLKTNNGDTTIGSSDYYLMCGNSYNKSPKDRIVLNYESSNAYFDFSSSPQRANHVTAIWGFHDDYANAWADSMATLVEDITASQTVFSVSSVTGVDELGLQPQLKEMQTIKIGVEFMDIMDINNRKLTVKRGHNGTTKATHVTGDSIYTYQPMPHIVQVTKRLANWLYMQKDSSSESDRPIVTPTGVTILPNKIPTDVEMMLKMYQYKGEFA